MRKQIIYISLIADRFTNKRTAHISRGTSTSVYHPTRKSQDRLCRAVNNCARSGQWYIETWPYAHTGWLAKPIKDQLDLELERDLEKRLNLLALERDIIALADQELTMPIE